MYWLLTYCIAIQNEEGFMNMNIHAYMQSYKILNNAEIIGKIKSVITSILLLLAIVYIVD